MFYQTVPCCNFSINFQQKIACIVMAFVNFKKILVLFRMKTNDPDKNINQKSFYFLEHTFRVFFKIVCQLNVIVARGANDYRHISIQ